MLKKYRVSLAVNVPHNYEVEINAESKYEAYEKGVQAFESDGYGHAIGEVVEVPDGSAKITLDLSDPDKNGDIPSGACVEEIKKEEKCICQCGNEHAIA